MQRLFLLFMKKPESQIIIWGKILLDSKMQYRKEGVSMGLPSLSEYEIFRTSEQKVRNARKVLNGYC